MQSDKRNLTPARLFGLLMMAAGVAGWWYNRHLAATEHQFYIKLCVFEPLAVFGGLLLVVRPEWARPMQAGSTRAHKIAVCTVMALTAVLSGVEFFHLKHVSTRRVSYTPWSPSMGTPVGLENRMPFNIPVSTTAADSAAAPAIEFMGHRYRLASFNQKSNPQWEFVTAGDTIDNWNTLITVIDRPDAHGRQELDRLAEGILSTYKSHGAKILMAKTMQDRSGAPYNYMVAAFEEPANRRFELNFVKIGQGAANAGIMICGVRISDSQDYMSKAKQFLDQHSGEIGRALGDAALPDVGKWPRRVF
jgi:hypothetical protein